LIITIDDGEKWRRRSRKRGRRRRRRMRKGGAPLTIKKNEYLRGSEE